MTELRTMARRVLMLVAAAASTCTMAQTRAPSAAASSAIEKAQQESDRTMYWIRVLAQTPPAKPAAPRARVAAAPVHVKVDPPSPAAASIVASAAAPAPAPAARSRANVAGAAITTDASAMPASGPDPGGAIAAAAAGPGASSVPPPPVELPPIEEAPDPGLAMVKSVDPQFPAGEMLRLRKGQVEVKFEVSPEGVVDAVTVMKTTHPNLIDAALEAVRQWRFEPTSRRHTALVDLAFDLDGLHTPTHRGRRFKPLMDTASVDRGR